MSEAKRHIADRSLLVFFALCFVLSWALWMPLVIGRPGPIGFALLLVGSLVPSALAIILTALNHGRFAVRSLLGRLLTWRVGVRWYLVLLVPTLVVLIAIIIDSTLWGGPPLAPAVTPLAAIAMVAFMIFPGSATGEEIGWRGYALPRLQVGRSALSASLILGTVHALWHLPLWWRATAVQPLSLYPAFAIQVVAYAVIYTWLYNSTRGSLLLVVLFHAATNAPLTLIVAPIAGSEALPVIFWLITGLTVLWAAIVVAIFHPLNLSRDNRQQADDLTTSQRDRALNLDPNKHLQRG